MPGGKHAGKRKSSKLLQHDIEEIANLQDKLFAENRQSLLIILQGMDS
jgi:polyphosphate kinase 2 (PPK2 family)